MAGQIDGNEAQRDQLAQDRAPQPGVVLGADAEGRDAVMAELGDALVLHAQQHIDDIGMPEAFAGALDAGQGILCCDGSVEQLRRGEAGVAIAARLAVVTKV